VRQFKLINANGQEFDLMDKTTFFQSPSGLGFENDLEYINAGYSFIETDSELSQKTISGEIAFLGYDKYSKFIRFCNASPLTFCYKPSAKWYYIKCKLEKIGKTELKVKRLMCPVDFVCIGTWYESVTVTKTELDESIGKIYDYAYNYTYAETTAGSTVINNTGDIPSPCKIHIKGPITNPSWALIKDGINIMSGKVFATIPDGNKIIINSSPEAMEISEYTNDGVFVGNLYGSSDFSTERFIIIPAGESTLTFTHEGAGVIDAFVEVNILATSV
jgi:hypothetical protein